MTAMPAQKMTLASTECARAGSRSLATTTTRARPTCATQSRVVNTRQCRAAPRATTARPAHTPISATTRVCVSVRTSRIATTAIRARTTCARLVRYAKAYQTPSRARTAMPARPVTRVPMASAWPGLFRTATTTTLAPRIPATR